MEYAIGKRLNEILARQNKSPHSFALENDMNVSTITDIASGRTMPRVDTIIKIAKGLNVDVRELFTTSSDVKLLDNNEFLREVHRRSAGYDVVCMGMVLGYMARVAEEREQRDNEEPR